jgi:hypothetical protein
MKNMTGEVEAGNLTTSPVTPGNSTCHPEGSHRSSYSKNKTTCDLPVEGVVIHQETLDHLDPIKRLLAVELIRQGCWRLVPGTVGRGQV